MEKVISEIGTNYIRIYSQVPIDGLTEDGYYRLSNFYHVSEIKPDGMFRMVSDRTTIEICDGNDFRDAKRKCYLSLAEFHKVVVEFWLANLRLI